MMTMASSSASTTTLRNVSHKIVKVHIPHQHTSVDIKWRARQSILDLALENELLSHHIEGACSGTMACCTCHVYLDDKTFEALGGEPEGTEQDMLDIAFEPHKTSRLGCQVKLNEALMELDEIILTIPSSANNHWD